MFNQYDDIITVYDLMEMLLIGKGAAYKLLASGEIKCFRYHRVWKIPRQSVIDYIVRKSSMQ